MSLQVFKDYKPSHPKDFPSWEPPGTPNKVGPKTVAWKCWKWQKIPYIRIHLAVCEKKTPGNGGLAYPTLLEKVGSPSSTQKWILGWDTVVRKPVVNNEINRPTSTGELIPDFWTIQHVKFPGGGISESYLPVSAHVESSSGNRWVLRTAWHNSPCCWRLKDQNRQLQGGMVSINQVGKWEVVLVGLAFKFGRIFLRYLAKFHDIPPT